ncbi:MAG TPA: GDSL-type esterase/lipase family protein [Thermoanaerobaculia bacterium]|jgi:lysophospholipase L1-like esterase|nr:GDSL-type esterase/lipase family protein [Thermoanaerobaculia bacterium]
MKRLLVAVVLLGAVGAVVIARRNAIERREIANARALLNDGILRAVVLGDSVARGAGDERGLGIAGSLDQQFQTLGIRAATVANLGINGARTFNVGKLLEKGTTKSAVRTADVIVLSIGGNDLYGDSAARLLSGIAPALQQHRTLENVRRIVTKVRELNPAARIYVLGLYNPYRQSSLRSWLDRQVNLWDGRLTIRFASARDLTVVRICDLLNRDDRISGLDHFHPGTRGYQRIAERIASSI